MYEMIQYYDPQQELFTGLKLALETEFGKAYDTELPPKGTPYPFIYLADTIQIEDPTYKHELSGTINQTIKIFHNDSGKRGTLSSWCAGVKAILRNYKKSEHYNFKFQSVSSQIQPDKTTSEPLMAAIIDVTYTFT